MTLWYSQCGEWCRTINRLSALCCPSLVNVSVYGLRLFTICDIASNFRKYKSLNRISAALIVWNGINPKSVTVMSMLWCYVTKVTDWTKVEYNDDRYPLYITILVCSHLNSPQTVVTCMFCKTRFQKCFVMEGIGLTWKPNEIEIKASLHFCKTTCTCISHRIGLNIILTRMVVGLM